MSNFEKSITVVLLHEGGWVNNPKDPGGETKYGITKRSYPHLDIKTLTKSKAKAIYKKDFWAPFNYDQIENDDVATKIFDTSVNMGSKRAFRFAQLAMNHLGHKLKVDGIFGPKSVATINATSSEAFLKAFRAIQSDYYRRLVAARPTLGVFLRGWLNRAAS